ncbi:MAG: hypothetical protein CMH53_01885, partial [Myxococcales bacterium]|nr:hypothetical protein [Myxococcales bacterium]
MSKSLIVATVLLALALSTSQTAMAAPGPDINAQSFELAPAQADGIWARSALAQGSLDWSLRVLTTLQNNSLAFSSRDNERTVTQRVHASLWTMQLAAASGWGKWTFAMTLPVALRIASEGPNLLGFDRPLAPLFGDLRLEARRHLWQKVMAGIGQLDLAAGVMWALPTGASGSWLSEGGARFDLMGIASWRRGPWSADGSLIFRLRPLTQARVQLPPAASQVDPSVAVALAVGSEWLMQLEAERRWLRDRLGAHLALQIRGAMSSQATSEQTLVEGMLYADWRMNRGAWKLWGGIGGGVTQAYGSAQVRGVGGVQFDPESVSRDSDDDGFDDRDDKCPNAAEDADGFE